MFDFLSGKMFFFLSFLFSRFLARCETEQRAHSHTHTPDERISRRTNWSVERHDPIKIFIITQTVAGGYLLETVAIIIMNQPKSQKAQKERRHKHTHTQKNYPEQQKSVPSVRHHTMGRIVVVQAKANCDVWKVNHIKRFSSLFFCMSSCMDFFVQHQEKLIPNLHVSVFLSAHERW